MHSIQTCPRLYHLSKNYTYVPDHHRQHALEHIRRIGNNFAIYTDGSKFPIAAVSNGKTLQFTLTISASLFTAELSAIWEAIEIIKEQPPQKFAIFSDSKSVIEAVHVGIIGNKEADRAAKAAQSIWPDQLYIFL